LANYVCYNDVIVVLPAGLQIWSFTSV